MSKPMKVFKVTHTVSGSFKTSLVATTDKIYVRGLLTEHYGEDVNITAIQDPYPPLATKPKEGVI